MSIALFLTCSATPCRSIAPSRLADQATQLARRETASEVSVDGVAADRVSAARWVPGIFRGSVVATTARRNRLHVCACPVPDIARSHIYSLVEIIVGRGPCGQREPLELRGQAPRCPLK